MRIHGVTRKQVNDAFREVSDRIGGSVWAETLEHGSRSHGTAVELKLLADDRDDRPDGRPRRRPNAGTRGGSFGCEDFAASYEEWGWVLGAIFDLAPRAVCGSPRYPVYNGASDFHAQTHFWFDRECPNLPDPSDRDWAERIVRNPERFSRRNVIAAKATIVRQDIASELSENGLYDLASYVREHGPVKAVGFCDAEIARARQEDADYHRGEGWELGNLEVARDLLAAAARKS